MPSTPNLRALLLAALLPTLSAAGTIHSDHPAAPVQSVSLEELWTVGGADSDLLFGLMIDARCDENGDVYLLDHQLSQATRVSAEGEVLAVLGGEGEGTGPRAASAAPPPVAGPCC